MRNHAADTSGINNPEYKAPASPTGVKNGIYNGIYYENDVPVHKGAFKIGNNIYHAGQDGVIAAGGYHVVHSVKTNGLVKNGTYNFASDGRLIPGSYLKPKPRRRKRRMINGEAAFLVLALFASVVLLGVSFMTQRARNEREAEAVSDYAAADVTENGASIRLPTFDEPVYLCTAPVESYYRGELSIDEAIAVCNNGGAYKGFEFEYMILQNPDSGDGAETKAVLEISENKDYSDAMEFELDPDETELTADNLFPDTTYYYRVTAEDVVSGDKAGAVTDTETYTGQFTTADTSRFLNIPDLKNTRDTGGYETADGRVTKYGMIIRGTETDGLLESSYFLKDRETAASFGFRYDFDLREDWTLTGNYQSMLGKNVSHKFYTAPSYGDVFNEAFHPALKEIFHDLSNPRNYPMYMHCTYGADRTGTIIFLLQGILGVPEEKMVEEYALTGLFREVNNSNRINSIFGGLEGTEGATINEKIVNYLTGTVGVPMRDIENIRSILLEKH